MHGERIIIHSYLFEEMEHLVDGASSIHDTRTGVLVKPLEHLSGAQVPRDH